MSQSDNFDTDVDVEQPAEQTPEQAPEEAAGDESDSESPKPKSGFLFKAIIALVVAGGVGFFYLKSTHKLSPAKMAAAPTQQEQTAEPPPAESLPTPLPENKAADTSPSPAAETPAAPSMPAADSSESMPAAIPAKTAAASSEEPLAWNAPAAAPATPTAMEMPATVPSETPKTGKAETAKALSEDVIAATGEKIDGLEKRLVTLEESFSSLQEKIVTKADIESLQNTLGKLQQGLEAKKKAVKVTAKKAAKPAAAQAPAETAVQWKLKSAKPGTAWIAEGDSNELHTVSVGDMLPGIGKITTIDKDSAGHWAVTGTTGRISQ
jgi:intracellular multiplication protein IcmG